MVTRMIIRYSDCNFMYQYHSNSSVFSHGRWEQIKQSAVRYIAFMYLRLRNSCKLNNTCTLRHHVLTNKTSGSSVWLVWS